MRNSLITLLALLLMASTGFAGKTLSAPDVLVVANANANGSEPLGKYYCLSRDILTERLLILHTTSAALVSREEYDKSIAAPIRQFLTEQGLKDKIQCVVLMWGVPVRVLGTELNEDQKQTLAAYKTHTERLMGRMAVNLALLKSVGSSFPAPHGGGMALRELFDLAGVHGDPGLDWGSTLGQFYGMLPKRLTDAQALKDPAGRQIALRQLLALRLEVFGIRDALANWPAETLPGLPQKEDLSSELSLLELRMLKLPVKGETAEIVREKVEIDSRLHGCSGAYQMLQGQIAQLDSTDEDASVDSELSMLWQEPYNLHGQIANPLNWKVQASTTKPASLPRQKFLMTARIDGPTAADALRIIKDSVEAEKTGLSGKFYIDAGGKYPEYDVFLKNLAEAVKAQTKIPVVYDTSPELFPPGSCPNASLYVGWYSLQKYVPAFTFVKGAVGYHIASLEAMHLRTANSEEWCPKLIQNGIAATLGAVNEPYLGSFPLPNEFFALLLSGDYTLAEVYWRTVPTTSWRLTLIGDPLYNPFRLHPEISVHSLPPALAGADKLEPEK